MYCRNCGKQISDKAEICISCGVRPLLEKNFCQECGAETKPNQEICIKCGVRLGVPSHIVTEQPVFHIDFSNLSKYYQEEFTSIRNSNEAYRGKWNWMAFLFGGLWALTKGVWLAPIIVFVVVVILGVIAAPLGWIVAIIYWFIFGARGNWMYYNAYNKKKQIAI